VLRRPPISLHECDIVLLERGLQPALYVQQDPPLVGVSAYRSQNRLVGNRVEEGSDVKIDHRVPSPTPLSADSHRLHCRAPRSIAVRVAVKQRLHTGSSYRRTTVWAMRSATVDIPRILTHRRFPLRTDASTLIVDVAFGHAWTAPFDSPTT
jgi:hypothetical protein